MARAIQKGTECSEIKLLHLASIFCYNTIQPVYVAMSSTHREPALCRAAAKALRPSPSLCTTVSSAMHRCISEVENITEKLFDFVLLDPLFNLIVLSCFPVPFRAPYPLC
jgi:hypothetical protein